jgi:hypothetical protein
LESYYCILRWKNLIRGSFYKKTTKKHFFWGGKKLESVAPPGTTPIFLFGLNNFKITAWKLPRFEYYVKETCKFVCVICISGFSPYIHYYTVIRKLKFELQIFGLTVHCSTNWAIEVPWFSVSFLHHF